MASLEEVLGAFRKFPHTTFQGSTPENLMPCYLELDQMYAHPFDRE